MSRLLLAFCGALIVAPPALVATSCTLAENLGPLGDQNCPTGSKACNNRCVTLNNPLTSCSLPGSCGPCTPPHAVPRCASNGECDIASCYSGYNNCDNNPTNGCEVEVDYDPLNCGRCAVVCPTPTNGVPGCSKGGCVILACNLGFGDCDGVSANGCEVDLTTDRANCGRCGNACGAAQVCGGTASASACQAGVADGG